ncbi:9760_t:CDS:2, partial [Cetraspora pellucida]
EGSNFVSGDNIEVSFCPDKSITQIDSIDLMLQLPDGFVIGVHNLQTGIQLESKECYTYTYILPSVAPDARYSISITTGPTLTVSGTFFINNPGYGLVISNPTFGQKVKKGNKLTVTWNDPFKLYQNLSLDIIFVTGPGSTILSPLATNVSVSLGKKTVTIPENIQSLQGYNIVIQVNRPSSGLGVEPYASDTFTIF